MDRYGEDSRYWRNIFSWTLGITLGMIVVWLVMLGVDQYGQLMQARNDVRVEAIHREGVLRSAGHIASITAIFNLDKLTYENNIAIVKIKGAESVDGKVALSRAKNAFYDAKEQLETLHPDDLTASMREFLQLEFPY